MAKKMYVFFTLMCFMGAAAQIQDMRDGKIWNFVGFFISLAATAHGITEYQTLFSKKGD